METYKKKKSLISRWKLIVLMFVVAVIVLFILKYNGLLSQSTQCCSNPNHTTLVFTQILFRHGERTPMDNSGPYPNDPYKDFTYEPYGPGALTDVGKQTLLKVGKYIKRHYCDFIGNYHRDIVYAKSSPLPRNRASLLLVLAGLFPPEKSKALADDLNWQPIPYDFDKINTETTFLYFYNCEKYIHLYKMETEKSIKNNEIKNFKWLVEKLLIHTGTWFTNYRDLFTLHIHLIGQKEFGLKLERWTEEYLPILEEYESISYNISGRTDELKTLSGGFILSEMIESIKLKIDNPEVMKHRKIHLYSGHDFTIANLMTTLGLKVRRTIPYGSFISMELHLINGEFAIRMLFKQPSFQHPELLVLDGCSELCPLETFLNMFSKYKAKPEMCRLESFKLLNSTDYEKYYRVN